MKLQRKGKAMGIGDKNLDESELIQNIKNNDQTAFAVLFDHYSENLLHFAFRYVRSEHIAEDIVQEVFVKIWVNRDNLIVSLSLRSYLYTAVRNQSLKYLRHEKVKQKIDTIPLYDSPIQTPEDEYQTKETDLSIKDAINKLPEKCRQIFEMSKYDNLSYIEIAEILGLSVNTVKTQMGRAFKFLRKQLKFIFVLSGF